MAHGKVETIRFDEQFKAVTEARLNQAMRARCHVWSYCLHESLKVVGADLIHYCYWVVGFVHVCTGEVGRYNHCMSAHAQQSVVASGSAKSRRSPRFDSIDQAVAEMERLAEAERGGKLRRVGDWTLGQALGALATWEGFWFAACAIGERGVV